MTVGRGNKWHLQEQDVTWIESGTRTGNNRKKLARSSRRVNITSSELTLKHTPSGIEVKDCVPAGHYSRKQMRKAKNELRERLWPELEKKVAKHRRESRGEAVKWHDT